MTLTLRPGPRNWELQTDKDGKRRYRVVSLVISTSPLDGPFVISQCPGLFEVGASYRLGNDSDEWATCLYEGSVKPVVSGETNLWWEVEQFFSTEPPQRCADTPVTDPILEPAKVSGSFIKYTEEAVKNRFGLFIKNSAHEQVRGPQVEFDANRPTVKIEQNVATFLQAATLPQQMNDTLNAFPLWGLPARCIKLTVGPWERKFRGTCEVYFSRSLEFEAFVRVNPTSGLLTSGYDRDLMDEGTKFLNGHWDSNNRWVLDNIAGQPPDPNNPQHFKAAVDPAGNRITAPLDGGGLPAGVETFTPITLVANTALTNTTVTTLSPSAQPNPPGRITVTVTDVFGTLLGGGIEVIGKDANGVTLDEEFFITGTAGTYGFTTVGTYAVLTSIKTSNVQGATGLTLVRATTPTSITEIGNVHVEKYGQSNFLLLGVPVTLDTGI